jgi:hypothetical protein
MSSFQATQYVSIATHHYDVLTMLVRHTDDESSPAVVSDITDWQVTFLYYVLCLEVKAVAAARNKELQDHYAVKQWINTENDLTSIARSYRKIEEWARDARYEGRRFRPEELRQFLAWFDSVHGTLTALLSTATIPPPRVDPHALLGI